MRELPQQLVNGLLLGAMYGLVAIGYTVVYGIVQLINFAHGEIFMTGGFGALTVWLSLPDGTTMWLALPLMIIGAVVVAALVAVAAERFAYRPLRGASRLAPLITAIGLSLALQQAVWAWYPDAKSARTFPQIPGDPVHIGSATLQTGDFFLIAAAVVCVALLGWFLRRTRTGRGMQATAQDPDTAKLMGINTDRVIVVAFALGLNIVVGLAGLLDLGYVAFLGVWACAASMVSGSTFSPIDVYLPFSGALLVGAAAGLALVILMRTRPEGLIPNRRRQLEFHEAAAEPGAPPAPPATLGTTGA